MPEVVPGERRDPIAVRDAHATQRVGKLARARERLAKRIAVSWMISRDRYDLATRMLQFRMTRDGADQQWPIHHLSEHGLPPN